MNSNLVMTVLGPDRPGIVEAVSRLVAEHGGNWLESRMCRLGGQFAGILRVQIADPSRAPLTLALAALSSQGLRVVVLDDAPPATPASPNLAVVELVGNDRPGIVRDVASALARQRVNVEELSSEVGSAPMSGEPLFRARATLTLPPSTSLATLRAELERIASDLQVDISVQPLES